MGIFGAIGKVLSGKPVFTPQDQNTQQPDFGRQTGLGQAEPQLNQAAGKVIPNVQFGRIENHWDGGRQDVYADAGNDSPVPIFLDWVNMCGAKRQLDFQLRPGESRQLLIYSGPRFANRPGGYVEVQYRTSQDGDYFMNYHEIRSEQEGGEVGFRVTEILQRGPVKDLR